MIKICLLVLVAVAMVAGCAIVEQITKTATLAEMIAEEIGVDMAKNNPELINSVEPYYQTMRDMYESGDTKNLSILAQYGIEVLVTKYIGDDLDARRIKSKIVRLMQLSGLDTSTVDIPGLDEFDDMAPGYIISVAGAFVGGMRMVTIETPSDLIELFNG